MAAANKANPARGRESGDILLGSIDYVSEANPVVRIEKFDPLESEHRRAPSFVLTGRDKRRALGKRLAWWNSRRNGDLRPVGLYRTTRGGVSIRTTILP